MARRTILLAAILLAALPAGAGRETAEPVVVPDVEALEPTSAEVAGETVRIHVGGILVQVRHLDERQRADFFRQRSRLRRDPFPPRAAYPAGFTVFELSFLNGTKQEFQFSPGMASIVIGSRREREPYDIGSLYTFFDQVFQGDPAAVENALAAIYTRTVLLNPGERTSQLLVFEGLPRRTRRFTLNLDFLHLGSGSQDLAVPFRMLRARAR